MQPKALTAALCAALISLHTFATTPFQWTLYGLLMPQKLDVRFDTCHKDLRLMSQCVNSFLPVKVFSCHRTKAEQKDLCQKGFSNACTTSRHLSLPSLAVDMVPLQPDGGIIWDDWENLVETGYHALHCWYDILEMEEDLVWGFLWKNFPDPYHFEMRQEE